MNCLQEFSNISNLKLNNKKTEVLPINTPDETINAAAELDLKIVDSIKFVGAHTINNDDHKRELDLNFASANEKSENLMAKTEQRHVSSIGASIIYNTRVLSKYTHLLYNFHPSKEECEYMNNRARNFVRSFDGGRFLVTKERFFIPHQSVGLNLRLFGEFSDSLKSQLIREEVATRKVHIETALNSKHRKT